MKFSLTPTPVDLETLAAERPLVTFEKFKPNDFYGHAGLLKRYAGLADSFGIRAVMPHGPSFCHKLWDTELKDPCGNILAISEQQRVLYRDQCPHKRVQVIGSPVLYAARLLEDELDILRAGARGTIVFPTHSTHHVTVDFDQRTFIKELQLLPAEFQPVRVCLYWRDIQLGRHTDYLQAGFRCLTAGHMFDPEFVPRLLRLLAAHRQALANKLGSCVYYAAALGLPVYLRLQNTTYAGANPVQLAELSPALDLPAAVRFADTARLSPDEAAPIQKQLALAELGASALLGSNALRELLEQLPLSPEPEPAPARPRRTTSRSTSAESNRRERSNKCLLETTTATLVQELRPLVARHPRRAPGKITLDGRPLAYADLHSLYHQAQQIFIQKLYDFTTTTDRPVIIDGGAHLGLASIYFARRYPQATVHAFEADPQIAGLLAANVGAFDLKNVQVHPRALWTSSAGVTFNATADDSGHVASEVRTSNFEKGFGSAGVADFSPRENCHQRAATKVPSVRLRDVLAREPVDLLKLDIEGAEFAVLRDCDGALGGVRNILIEVHRFRDADGQLGELLAVLERNGFDYALGDLHAATWIESAARPPFSACPSRHYIVTVFAWRAQGTNGTDGTNGTHRTEGGAATYGTKGVAAPRLTIDALLRDGVDHLNARRESDALRCFESAVASGATSPHLHYGRSVALARLGRHVEARQLLGQLQPQLPGHLRAAALATELDALTAPRLYIASYPRSGNTWLRLLLADVILQQHGYATATQLPIHADHIIPDLHLGRVEDVDRRLRLPCALLKSHDRFDRLIAGRAVCIFRQAADSLVSYYHYHLRYPHLAPKAAEGVEAFCRQHVVYWKAHLKSFLQARHDGAEIHFISYEALHADGVNVLGKVTRFIGLNADERLCRQAIDNHLFTKRQAAERKAHGDKYAVPFFRQGRVNGAADELPPDTLDFLAAETATLYREAQALERSPTTAGGAITPSRSS